MESGLVRKWVRQRCQEAPGKTVAMASSAPDRRSEVTNWTPPRPSAVSERRTASQNAPS